MPFPEPNGSFTGGIRNSTRARVGGSGFTVFWWEDKPILYARQISHQSPAPVGPGTVPIHPMDTPYPVELVTPQATSMGTLTLELYELYGSNVWERLASYLNTSPGNGGSASGPVDLAGIFDNVARRGQPISIVKYIKPPQRTSSGATGAANPPGNGRNYYTEEYKNCVISQLQDGETIEVGTMEVLKQIVVNYTHIERGGRNHLLVSNQLGDSESHFVPPSRYS